jgi:NAD(P)H-quinone oxidoreductase subunit 4
MTDSYKATMEVLVAKDEQAMKAMNTPAGSGLIRQAPLRAPALAG